MREGPRRGGTRVPGGGGVDGAALSSAAIVDFAAAPTPFPFFAKRGVLQSPAGGEPRADGASTGALPLRGGARRRPEDETPAAVSMVEASVALKVVVVVVAQEASPLTLSFFGFAVGGVVALVFIPFRVNVSIPLVALLPVAAVVALLFFFAGAEGDFVFFAAPPAVVSVAALLPLFLVFFADVAGDLLLPPPPAFWDLCFFELLLLLSLMLLLLLQLVPAATTSSGEDSTGGRLLLLSLAGLLPGGVTARTSSRPVAAV